MIDKQTSSDKLLFKIPQGLRHGNACTSTKRRRALPTLSPIMSCRGKMLSCFRSKHAAVAGNRMIRTRQSVIVGPRSVCFSSKGHSLAHQSSSERRGYAVLYFLASLAPAGIYQTSRTAISEGLLLCLRRVVLRGKE